MSFPYRQLQKNPPIPRRGYIVRSKLYVKLGYIENCHLTSVSGGAGSGKTTLLASYIREKQWQNVLWFSLSEDLNSPLIFWSQAVILLSDWLPDDEHQLSEYLTMDPDPESISALLALFCDLLPQSEPAYLILDDFHLLKDEQLLTQFEYFIANSPADLHIILLSRIEPKLYLGSLAMEGGLLLIDEQDLRFEEGEALQFLQNTLSLPFYEKTLRTMVQLAEGWIGGLQLIAAGSYGKSETEITNMKLSGNMLSEYITREIFDRLEQRQQEFLVFTAPLFYFSPQICEYIIKDCDFISMMESLSRKNLLLQCLDEEQRLYRYHHILEEYLRQRFERLPEEARKKVRLNAAKAFEETGDFEEALRQLFILKEWPLAMDLLLKMSQSASTLVHIRSVPVEAAIENIDFAYQKFFAHYSFMENDICISLCNAIAQKGDQDEATNSFQDLRFLIDYDAKDLNLKNELAEDIEKLPLSDVSKVLVFIKRASYFFYQSLYPPALNYLEKAASYPFCSQNNYLHYFLLNVKAQILEALGYLTRALHLYQSMEDLLTANKGLRLLWPSYHIGITGVFIKQMKLEKAAFHLAAAEELTDVDDKKNDFSWYFNKTEYLALSGKESEADQIIETYIAKMPSANLLTIAALFKYQLKTGTFKASTADAFQSVFLSSDVLASNLENRFAYIRILIWKGEKKEAVTRLNQELAFAREGKITYRIVEGALLKLHILKDEKGKEREIKNLWREAISYASEENIRLPFILENNNLILPDAASLGRLDEKEMTFLQELKKEWGETEKGLLSKREYEVLKLLAAGNTNKEIAEMLCISLATVKTHIINIYGKLQVNSRVAAVEAARQRGILAQL